MSAIDEVLYDMKFEEYLEKLSRLSDGEKMEFTRDMDGEGLTYTELCHVVEALGDEIQFEDLDKFRDD